VAPTCQDWKALIPSFCRAPRSRLVSLYHLAEVVGQEAGPNDRIVPKLEDAFEVFLLAYRARKGGVFHTAASEPWIRHPRQHRRVPGQRRQKTICVDSTAAFQLKYPGTGHYASPATADQAFALINRDTLPISRQSNELLRRPQHRMRPETGVSSPIIARSLAPTA